MDEQQDRRTLGEADVREARRRYADLYARAFPHAAGLAELRIEVATLNLAATWAEFEQAGLGLETVVIHREADGSGHTGKVLMSLPGQFLPEHQHVDTWVLRAGAELPDAFVELGELVRDFHGIRDCESDGTVRTIAGRPVYLYPAGEYRIVQARDGRATWPPERKADVVALLGGKSETFKTVLGESVLLSDRARVLHAPGGVDPADVPVRLRERVERVRRAYPVTTRREIYLGPGVEVLLPKGTPHALVAGPEGFVCLEFSAPSLDEADRFTDPRVIR